MLKLQAEAPRFQGPPMQQLYQKRPPDSGKDGRQEEKRATEYETAGWCHWLKGHELEQASGDCEGQGSLGAEVHGVSKSRTLLST